MRNTAFSSTPRTRLSLVRLVTKCRLAVNHRICLIAGFISLLGLMSVYVVFAAISLSTTTAYTENFDGMGTSATATLPVDFRVDRPTTVRTVGTFAAALTATTASGGANLSSTASNGIYNFGSGTTTTGPDRSVGFLSSGTATQSGNLYAQLVNNTGGNLSGVQISYDVEKYRNGLNPNGFRIQVFYSHDGATWTNAGSDFLTSFAPDAANTGFSPAPGTTVSVTNKILTTTVANGANLYLAWNYSVSATSTTTNAQALAIDNVSIIGIAGGGSTDPTGVGAASPNSVLTGASSTLTVSVTPGTTPASTGLVVTADLSSIGGSSSQQMFDDGTNGDVTPNNNVFTYFATVAVGTTAGMKSLPFTINDAEMRSGSGSISLTVQEPPPPLDHVVISQVYGGGGNTGATYTNDYVELYNPTGVSFNLAGWTLQYGSATGTTWTNNQPLGGIIAPGEYYLVGLASGGAVGAPLPDQNISGSINMAAGAGKIVLVNNSTPLSGGCPIGTDPDIVDFVGYGTTANCFEGSGRAPAASNTTALFRKADGAQDTNQNSADFVAALPNPRRTTPIQEIGPWVAFTEPGSNDSNVPFDATMSITFSEAMDVEGAWYDISCAGTGQHSSATVASSNGFKTFAITPNTSFQFGELCTVTIFKDQVRDQDLDDTTAGTDTLPDNYLWSFQVVAAGAPAPYPPSVHLDMGNPSSAIADLLQANNYLMEKPGFSLSYNRDRGTPNWVSWHLDPSWFGTLPRFDTFRPDPAVPPDWYRVQATDYFSSGFDRGHHTPNADRDHQDRRPINQETFLMTNMLPQAPDQNQGPWANMEQALRDIAGTGKELYIVMGGHGIGGTGDNGFKETIADGHVSVPNVTWKVVLVLAQGTDDVNRVTGTTRTIAVIMPNSNTSNGSNIRDDNWQDYIVSVDQVESLTGYDFFSNVADAVENGIEAGINGNNPPGTAGQSVTTNEDNSVNITLTAASPGGALTYTIVSGPTHGQLTGSDGNRTYTPNLNYFGSDSFTFKVNDGTNDSNTSTVSITVNPVNDDPDAVDDVATVAEDSGANTINVQGNDSDVEGDTRTIVAVTQGTNGSVAITNSGANLSYTPAANFFGSDSFTYTVSDGNGGSDTATVDVTVTNVNDAPVLTSSVATSLISATNSNLFNVGLEASATDQEGETVTIQVSVFGDEDDQTPTVNNVVHSPDAKDFAPNALRLRGERIEANDGRVYLIIVTATDTSGGISRNYHTVVVPKNNKQANIDSVNAQAAAAISFASSNGGAPPPGYFVIGDGPIIGPKQ